MSVLCIRSMKKQGKLWRYADVIGVSDGITKGQCRIWQNSGKKWITIAQNNHIYHLVLRIKNNMRRYYFVQHFNCNKTGRRNQL